MDTLDHNDDMPSRWSGLKQRTISAVPLAAALLIALWLGGWIFTVLVIAAGLQMFREWNGLTERDNAYWKIAGISYVAIPCASLIWLRNTEILTHPNAGIALVLYVLFVVWATDIGAYFTGRKFGKRKLAPTISPGKTWEGLGGGIASAAIIGALCSHFIPYPPSILTAMELGALLAIIAQGGDLFESWLKRRVGAKDSGTLIPGHGGLLDRVDGLTFTLPLFAFMVFLSGIVS